MQRPFICPVCNGDVAVEKFSCSTPLELHTEMRFRSLLWRFCQSLRKYLLRVLRGRHLVRTGRKFSTNALEEETIDTQYI